MAMLPDGPVRDTPNGVIHLPNSVIQSHSISLEARGLYAYLASFDVLPTFAEILNRNGATYRELQSATRELVQAGLAPETILQKDF